MPSNQCDMDDKTYLHLFEPSYRKQLNASALSGGQSSERFFALDK